jgi:opacity protein-like surface antigen
MLIAVAAVAVNTAGAFAADMPGNSPGTLPPPELDHAIERVELSSGWYLRGDVAYRFQQNGASSSVDPTQVPSPTSGKVDGTYVLGAGAGIKLGWFRLEMSGDYGWRAKYRATTAAGNLSGTVESFTVMGNGYIDLGTWSGFTPYLGAGIGGADLVFSGYQNPSAVAPMPSTAGVVQRWNVAWSAMAGVSYNVAHDLLLDVGYRHIDMGNMDGGPNGLLKVKNLTGDEIRVGLRYLID